MSRESFETDALVLKAAKYGENDVVLTLLSAEYGILAVFAKNIEKSKKNRIFIQPFTYARFELKKNDGHMFVFSSAELIESFYALRNDINSLAVGQYFLEVCLLIPENAESSAWFLKLTLNSLYLLTKPEKQVSSRTVKLVFEIMFLQYAGFMPNTRSCAVCGDEPSFWSYDNGFLCEKCSFQSGDRLIYPMTSPMISAIRHITENAGIAAYRFSLDDNTLLHLSSLTQKYMEYRFETHFRSTGYII